MNYVLLLIAPISLVMGIVGAFIPYWISPPGQPLSDRKKLLMSLGNCFSGGVLLSAGVIHMIPDQMEAAEALGIEGPFPQLSILVGLFILIIFEYSGLVHQCLKRNSAQPTDTAMTQSLLNTEEGAAKSSDAATTALSEHDHDHDHEHDHHDIAKNGSLPIVIALVLAVHSMFESFTLGASTDEKAVVSLTIAIMAHRIFESFALGISCRKANVSYRKAAAGIVAFAFVGPASIFIGWGVKSIVDNLAKQWIELIFLGIAAGTFLYLSLIEVVSEELDEKGGNGFRFLALFLGAAGMAACGFAV